MKRRLFHLAPLLFFLQANSFLVASSEEKLSTKEQIQINRFLLNSLHKEDLPVYSSVEHKTEDNGGVFIRMSIFIGGIKSNLGFTATIEKDKDIIIRDLQGFRRDTLRQESYKSRKTRIVFSKKKSARIQFRELSENRFNFIANGIKRVFRGSKSPQEGFTFPVEPLTTDQNSSEDTLQIKRGRETLLSYKPNTKKSGILILKAPFSPIQAFDLLVSTFKFKEVEL